MLSNEAKWVGRVLTGLPADAFPLLNVGSQTRWFREVDQPSIEQHLFGPLRRAGRTVVHTDLREGEGIDVSGDLMDAAFRRRLVEDYGVRSVLCCNVLEHVSDPVLIAATLAEVVERRGGHLVVSVPRSFPYHPDPIDTMFRPAPADLNRLVEPLVPVSVTTVRSGSLVGYSVGRLLHDRNSAATNLRASTAAHETGRAPRELTDLLPWVVRPFVVTCGWYRADPRGTHGS
jgi:hypothetical protein